MPYRPSELAREFGFSLAQICEIEALLKTIGLRLGTRLDDWPPSGLDRTPRPARSAAVASAPPVDDPRGEPARRR